MSLSKKIVIFVHVVLIVQNWHVVLILQNWHVVLIVQNYDLINQENEGKRYFRVDPEKAFS